MRKVNEELNVYSYSSSTKTNIFETFNREFFCRYDESKRKKLHLLEPWVTYGIPSKSIIADLIRRSEHEELKGESRVPLSDNTIAEKATDGEVICVDDIVHELYTVGKDFDEERLFSCRFQLSALSRKFQKRKLNFKDGGDYGDCGSETDKLIHKIL